MGLSLVLALALVVAFTAPAFAQNPTVSITVRARLIAITNSEDTWDIGIVVVNDEKYFSVDNAKDNTYSTITNAGNVAVDVEIQGTDLVAVDTTYNWTLNATAGDQHFSLHANSEATPDDYDVEVKKASYNDLCTDLAAAGTYDWSMLFVAPSAFHTSDDGEAKSATVTLVASLHT